MSCEYFSSPFYGICSDRTYAGLGDRNVTSSALSGGTGELTGGVIPIGSWTVDTPPHVG